MGNSYSPHSSAWLVTFSVSSPREFTFVMGRGFGFFSPLINSLYINMASVESLKGYQSQSSAEKVLPSMNESGVSRTKAGCETGGERWRQDLELHSRRTRDTSGRPEGTVVKSVSSVHWQSRDRTGTFLNEKDLSPSIDRAGGQKTTEEQESRKACGPPDQHVTSSRPREVLALVFHALLLPSLLPRRSRRAQIWVYKMSAPS